MKCVTDYPNKYMEAKTIKRYSNTSTKNLLKKAQKYFNEYIRLRDSDANGNFRCISCGQMKSKEQLQAGHYFPAGQNFGVRFDERNVNGECVHCNYYSGEHLIGYQKNLIKKIGQEAFDDLVLKRAMTRNIKIDRFKLIEVIEEYKEKSKELREQKNG